MKRIVKPARKTPKKSPAIPSTAEIASGTEAEICCAPSWTFPPAPRRRATTARPTRCSSCDESPAGRGGSRARPPTSGTSSRARARARASAVPSTVSVAASPRDSSSSPSRTAPGTRTRARGRCRGTRRGRRRRSPRNAATIPTAATTISTVRIGSSISVRLIARAHGPDCTPGPVGTGRPRRRRQLPVVFGGSSRRSRGAAGPRRRARERHDVADETAHHPESCPEILQPQLLGRAHTQTSAVHVEHGAARELGLGRGEEEHRRGDLLRRRDAAERALGARARRRAAPASSSAAMSVSVKPGATDATEMPCAAERAGERLAERDQPGLARAVGRRVGLAAERAARRDVDDPPAAAAAQHVLHGAPGHVGGADEVDAERLAASPRCHSS